VLFLFADAIFALPEVKVTVVAANQEPATAIEPDPPSLPSACVTKTEKKSFKASLHVELYCAFFSFRQESL
jgi:hypothetical protein